MPTTTLALYRSVRKEEFPKGVIVDDHAVTGVLYPTFEDKVIEIKKGGTTEKKTRPADVTPYTFKGEEVVDPGGGTSLFDKKDVFGTRWWWCFTIPEGTVIPDSLQIRFTGRNATYNADHYQIEAAMRRMPVESFKGALDNLARNAVAKVYELTH
jgi:hypothetical protein